jgi:hypothetical protein
MNYLLVTPACLHASFPGWCGQRPGFYAQRH